MANLQVFAKWGLIMLIIVSIAVLIERLEKRSSVSKLEDNSTHLEINSTIPPVSPTVDIAEPTVDITEPTFAKEFSECIAKLSVSFRYPLDIDQPGSICMGPHKKCLHDFVVASSKFMQNLGIKLLLIEPFLLFCLLPSARKFNLMTRGFEPVTVPRAKNVITFGIHQSDVKILNEESVRSKILSQGYRIGKFESDEVGTSHYFIIAQDLMMHFVVLNPRSTYLWSAGFNTSEVNLNHLQYINDTAFENFTTSLVHLDTSSTVQLFLPSDARCFLLDAMSSKFIECKAVPSNVMNPNHHTELVMALKELKKVLASQMVIFWMWSKTLQGWFEECDPLHYSEELKFSVSAKSVHGYNFTGLFTGSDCQHVESNFNSDSNNIKNIKLDCYGVSIDLIFVYEDEVEYWYEYVSEHIYRVKFPKFTLCSTDIYGQKIIIPCETEEIFEGEYGQFLKNTTLTLNSENMKHVQLMDTP